MLPLEDVAREAGIPLEALEPRRRGVAKVDLGLLERLPARAPGKLVAVTSLTPTPAGEGKTTVSVGLGMGLRRLGRRAWVTLREPSLGPLLGSKGGASGSGRARLEPHQAIDLWLAGDSPAVEAAHDHLAAVLDDHLHRGNALGLDPEALRWGRVTPLHDRALRRVQLDLGGGRHRRSSFEVVAASEVMAILALARDWGELRARLGRIVVGEDGQGHAVTAEALGAAGTMAALLRDALCPNLVQTAEGGPALVHTGPFGNLAHGNSSVVADLLALGLGEVVVTESGFGADLGFTKLMQIKAPALGRTPDAVVVVATVRALLHHAGLEPGAPQDPGAVRAGAANLERALAIVARSGLPALVALNVFQGDEEPALRALEAWCEERGVASERCAAWAQGGAGAERLARAVEAALERGPPARPLLDAALPARQRLHALACDILGADGATLAPQAEADLERAARWGLEQLPWCLAKTHLSVSHDPALLGAPRGWTLPVRAIRLAAGAGMLVGLCGQVLTLPGLPATPRAGGLDLLPDGTILGL